MHDFKHEADSRSITAVTYFILVSTPNLLAYAYMHSW